MHLKTNSNCITRAITKHLLKYIPQLILVSVWFISIHKGTAVRYTTKLHATYKGRDWDQVGFKAKSLWWLVMWGEQYNITSVSKGLQLKAIFSWLYFCSFNLFSEASECCKKIFKIKHSSELCQKSLTCKRPFNSKLFYTLRRTWTSTGMEPQI